MLTILSQIFVLFEMDEVIVVSHSPPIQQSPHLKAIGNLPEVQRNSFKNNKVCLRK